MDAGNLAFPGSAINTCEVTDQRGIARPYGKRCNMGALDKDSLLFGIFLPALIK
jgi:hypothetical protein